MSIKNVTVILKKPYSTHPDDSRLFVVLAINHKGEFVTWNYNEEVDGLDSGHYFGTFNKGSSEALRNALDDFDKRGLVRTFSLVSGDHSECGPDCCVTGDCCDGSHVRNEEKIGQFFMDILTTAVEGGINGWAVIRNLKRDEDLNVLSFECRDAEDPSEPWAEVNLDKIPPALNKIKLGDVKVAKDYRHTIMLAYADLDASNIDAMMADIIVQVAAFGECIFG